MITVSSISSAWKQERTIIHVSGIAATSNYVQLTSGTITAKYYGDTSGKLDIDISDLVRMATGAYFNVSLQEYNAAGTAQGSAVSESITPRGLINPANMIIPYNKVMDWMNSNGFNYPIICPPTTCIESGNLGQQKFEMLPTLSPFCLHSGAAYTDISRSTGINVTSDVSITKGRVALQDIFQGQVDVQSEGDWSVQGDNFFITGQFNRMEVHIGDDEKEVELTNGHKILTFTHPFNDSLYIYMYHGASPSDPIRIDNTALNFFDNTSKNFVIEFDLDVRESESPYSQDFSIIGFKVQQYIIGPAYSIVCTRAQKQICNNRYAKVRWTSRSGVQKQNVFEVRDVTDNTASKTNLLSIKNEYEVRKGQVQTLKLCIDNLTAYDYWYYSDMLTSSSVEVSMDGTNWVKVEVTDKGATIPNGNAGEFYSFVANVNYRRYDEV